MLSLLLSNVTISLEFWPLSWVNFEESDVLDVDLHRFGVGAEAEAVFGSGLLRAPPAVLFESAGMVLYKPLSLEASARLLETVAS